MSYGVSEEEYWKACDEHQGWCTACEDFTNYGVESDAEKYICENCDHATVMGAEQAMLLGYIHVEEE